MLTHVEFRSDAFPAYPDEEEGINPGRYGKRIAEYLLESLRNAGFEAGAPSSEDWGWLVPIRNDTFPLTICCGNYEEYPDGFLCFIEPHEPLIRRWFKRVDTRPQVEALQLAINEALSAHPGVRSLRWWTHQAFNNPGGA